MTYGCPRKSDARHTRYIYGPGGTPHQQINPDGTITYLHRDQLGSTRALTNNTGALVGERAYTPYGTPTITTGTTTPFGYTGQYTDTETQLQYLRARYYDPSTGQFISRDPLVSMTREGYGYTFGNPTNATDPSGLYCLTGVDKEASREEGHEVCNGVRQVADNLNPDKNVASQVWDHEWGVDWGTAVAGGFNTVYGGYKVYIGVSALIASPACGPLFELCAAAGAYSTVTGGARVFRGVRQLNRFREDPDGPDGQCTTGDNLKRAVRGVIPFGEGDWLDWVGGLP